MEVLPLFLMAIVGVMFSMFIVLMVFIFLLIIMKLWRTMDEVGYDFYISRKNEKRIAKYLERDKKEKNKKSKGSQ